MLSQLSLLRSVVLHLYLTGCGIAVAAIVLWAVMTEADHGLLYVFLAPFWPFRLILWTVRSFRWMAFCPSGTAELLARSFRTVPHAIVFPGV